MTILINGRMNVSYFWDKFFIHPIVFSLLSGGFSIGLFFIYQRTLFNITKTAAIEYYGCLLKSYNDYYKDLERAILIRYTRCAYMLRFTDSTFISPVVWLMVVTRSVVHWPAKFPLPK